MRDTSKSNNEKYAKTSEMHQIDKICQLEVFHNTVSGRCFVTTSTLGPGMMLVLSSLTLMFPATQGFPSLPLTKLLPGLFNCLYLCCIFFHTLKELATFPLITAQAT